MRPSVPRATVFPMSRAAPPAAEPRPPRTSSDPTITATIPPADHRLRGGDSWSEATSRVPTSLLGLAGSAPARVHPERWVAVGHQSDVRSDPEHPAIESEDEVEQALRCPPSVVILRPVASHPRITLLWLGFMADTLYGCPAVQRVEAKVLARPINCGTSDPGGHAIAEARLRCAARVVNDRGVRRRLG